MKDIATQILVSSSPVSHPFTLEEMGKNLPTLSQITAFDMRRALQQSKRKYSLKFQQLSKLEEPHIQVCEAKCRDWDRCWVCNLGPNA